MRNAGFISAQSYHKAASLLPFDCFFLAAGCGAQSVLAIICRHYLGDLR